MDSTAKVHEGLFYGVVRFDAVDAPNEQRISELEEERDRLARERERFVGRSRAIGDLAIPAAHREATGNDKRTSVIALSLLLRHRGS
jgi:hypothetical protein